jgi:hypothetical protein
LGRLQRGIGWAWLCREAGVVLGRRVAVIKLAVAIDTWVGMG